MNTPIYLNTDFYKLSHREMTKSEFEQVKDKLNPQGVVPKEINKVGDTHD